MIVRLRRHYATPLTSGGQLALLGVAAQGDDRDGVLDLAEWEQARLAARREVEKNHGALHAAPDTHALRQPRDGRLFLISTLQPDQLANRYRLWAWIHLALFIGALAATAARVLG